MTVRAVTVMRDGLCVACARAMGPPLRWRVLRKLALGVLLALCAAGVLADRMGLLRLQGSSTSAGSRCDGAPSAIACSGGIAARAVVRGGVSLSYELLGDYGTPVVVMHVRAHAPHTHTHTHARTHTRARAHTRTHAGCTAQRPTC